jgi:DNA primase
MGMREETQALNALGVHEVGNLLGIRLPTKGMARCPLPGHDDSTPSFEVRNHGRHWHCYGCNKKGGAIDLVMTYQAVSFLEAKKWLAERIGLESSRWPSQSTAHAHQRRISTPESPESDATIETTPDHNLYSEFIARSPLLKSGTEYLRGRSLSPMILSRFAIGQMPSISAITDLVHKFGFERVEASGLLTKRSTHNNFWPIFPQGALLFPYFEAGKVVYIQARTIIGNEKGSRWRNLNNRRRRLYNADVLSDPAVRRVAICEGATDVLSSTQLGCDAFGLIGVSAQLSDAEIKLLRGKQVDILLDWDLPGEMRASALRKELLRFGVAATRKSAPQDGSKDVNDFLRHGNTRI